MNRSHEEPAKDGQTPVGGDVNNGDANRIDRRRLIVTSLAAAPILMTLGVNRAVAQTTTNTTTTTGKKSSGIASGHSSVIKK